MNIVKNVFFALLFIAVAGTASFAKTWLVTFSYPTYSPSTLNVALGDTIVWSGDFTAHPLYSTSIPATAQPFSRLNGNIPYAYIVTVQGKYNYQCSIHYMDGMKGSFTSSTANVRENAIAAIALLNYPNPVGSSTSFHFNLPASGNVSMKLYDIKGNMVDDVMNGYRSSGENEVSVNTSNLANGTYICKFESGAYLITREIVVVK